MKKRIVSFLVPLLFLGLLYSLTLAPDLTWANRGADGGDLVTAAYIGGVAHPTGYPTYLFLLRIFQWFVPFGSIAFRSNLFSLVASLIAAGCVYHLIINELDKTNYSPAFAWIASISFGVSPLVWGQSVIAEVYTLNLAFIGVLLVLIQGIQKNGSSRKKVVLSGFLLGIASGNHITALFLAPFLAGVIYYRSVYKQGYRFKNLLLWGLSLLFGFAIYISIPLRAAQMPPVNWGDPRSWEGFIWLVTGRLYTPFLESPLNPQVVTTILKTVQLLFGQFPPIIWPLILLGIWHTWKYNRTLFLVFSGLFLLSFTFSILYRSPDAWTNLLPVVLYFAVLAGIGGAEIISLFPKDRTNRERLVVFVVLMGLIFHVVSTYPKVDASRDLRAIRFGDAVMASAPPHAILIADNDAEVFSLWYYQFVLGKRPDIVPIYDILYQQDWYITQLEHHYQDTDFGILEHQSFLLSLFTLNPNRTICVLTSSDPNPVACY
jgi:hypothetical protein